MVTTGFCNICDWSQVVGADANLSNHKRHLQDIHPEKLAKEELEKRNKNDKKQLLLGPGGVGCCRVAFKGPRLTHPST